MDPISEALEAATEEAALRWAAVAAAARLCAAVAAAHADRMTWQEVGDALGVTRARAEALARHRTDLAARKKVQVK